MNANEVIIPCRLSYANIWEPKQVNGTGDPKYSCCLLIKKSDTAAIAKLKAAIEDIKKADCDKLTEVPGISMRNAEEIKKQTTFLIS